ncbi:MAG: IclR family transcriptional regulator [Chloroflexota bacterium]
MVLYAHTPVRVTSDHAILAVVDIQISSLQALEGTVTDDSGVNLPSRSRRSQSSTEPGVQEERLRRRDRRRSTEFGTFTASPGGAQSVDRASDILLCFTQVTPVLALAELAERTALPKPTAHRLIQSLVSRGLMQRTADGRYELGFRIYELGMIAQTRLTLGSLAMEALDTLSAETGETVLLSRADFETLEVVLVHARVPAHALGVRPPSDRRSLVPPGTLGKSLLAALEPEQLTQVLAIYAQRGVDERRLIESGTIQCEIQRTRERGYAVDAQVSIPGATGVSSWLIFGNPRSIAALAVIAPSERLADAKIDSVGTRVKELASTLSFTGYRD